MEDQVLPLVLHVVFLETEHDPKPVQEVIVWVPWSVWWFPQVSGGA